MVERARKAQVIYDERFDQERVDQVIKVAARTIFDHAEELARLTIDETQMGVYEDKVAKNRNKSKGVWYNLKGKKSIGIFIGPEGGFDPKEVEAAMGAGASPVTLGRRILRTETAGLAMLSVLMFEFEEE